MNLLNVLKFFKADEFGFIDIGAFRGAFTDMIINAFPRSYGLLVEPTNENYHYLRNKFSLKQNIQIINYALGIKKSEADFFCTSDSAQNSLLEFVDANMDFVKQAVKVESLDILLKDGSYLQNIDLIKIDTQGNDLNVLKGGINTINKYMPTILSEIIFVPLYKNQANYFEQLEFMDNLGYKIAGIYDVHYHEPGVISYADFLFLPKDKFEKLSTGISTFANFVCYDVDTVINENKKLKAICQERLDLINNLSEEAGKRLDIINSLTQEIKRLQGQ